MLSVSLTESVSSITKWLRIKNCKNKKKIVLDGLDIFQLFCYFFEVQINVLAKCICWYLEADIRSWYQMIDQGSNLVIRNLFTTNNLHTYRKDYEEKEAI